MIIDKVSVRTGFLVKIVDWKSGSQLPPLELCIPSDGSLERTLPINVRVSGAGSS